MRCYPLVCAWTGRGEEKKYRSQRQRSICNCRCTLLVLPGSRRDKNLFQGRAGKTRDICVWLWYCCYSETSLQGRSELFSRKTTVWNPPYFMLKASPWDVFIWILKQHFAGNFCFSSAFSKKTAPLSPAGMKDKRLNPWKAGGRRAPSHSLAIQEGNASQKLCPSVSPSVGHPPVINF